MANIRPAGLSDEDTDEDDYGYDPLSGTLNNEDEMKNARKNTERNLQVAIQNGNIEEVAKIVNLDLHNEVNERLESGWTPLLHACFYAQEEIVQFLLDIDADPNITSIDFTTCVILVCTNTIANEATVYNIVSNLIERECLLNIGNKYGVTPLMKAILAGRPSVVRLMIDNGANIEMRDSLGWTAVFWAIHHNQAECLEILLSKGARLNIVDVSNRTPQLLADSHNNNEIRQILSRYSKNSEEDRDEIDNMEINNDTNNLTNWHDYYPGLRDENRPKYCYEINHLLYGMNCDHLKKIFDKKPIDLRKFLLLEDEDMVELGIDMPYERQRIKQGLHKFHMYGWKVGSVAGLQTERGSTYSMIKCVNILGNHLQQLYILEATLTYLLRGYGRIQNKIKYEPPDSPALRKLENAVKNMTSNINSIRKEINIMKKIHTRISKDSLKPVDLITEKTSSEMAVEIFTKLVVISSVSFLLYRAKGLITNMFYK
ncbi:unnamed protein product [Euphydryas editha]|uniref:Ankyrin repeat, SAM and basic leucine zipper domain-containing protein 1 n=1 Tax=Euphydryas editha TaxID=104508 RepID=A0AAU9U5B0_EUPED|nr:unnamed protein product [Euphydryas editha]